MADSGSDLCCGFYLGRIDHYLLYDADTENPAEKMDMFSVFIGWILLQLYHTFGIWRTAGTDLLYEKRKDTKPVSTLVLMIVTITYKLVLVVVGLWLVLFGQGFIHKYLWSIRHIFYLGTALNVFCVTAMLVLVFHPRLAREILVRGMALLEKLHFLRHKEARIEKLNASMDQYRDTAVFLKEHKQVIVNVFAITMFQRFALFTATWFVYKAFGLGGAKAVAVITLQAVIAVSVDMLPLPGGMGISEKLFTMIFIPVFGKRLLLPGMILSRGLGYYTELGLSALLTIVANFTIGRKREIEC